MKITKRQLRRIINEAFPGYASERPNNPMERWYKKVVTDYEAWVQAQGHITPAASSVLVTYLIDQGLEKDSEEARILTSEYKMDKTDVATRPVRRDFYEGTNMKITKRQLRKIVKEEKRKLREVYPIGGRDTSPDWEAFKDAAWKVAAGFIDAGMEADGIMSAMQDEISDIINEMESEWIEDEGDQDDANQQYADKHGNPWDE